MLRKQETGQVTIVNWFGRAIALHMLENQHILMNMTLGIALENSLSSSRFPFPLFVVSDENGRSFEFTSQEFGSWDLQAWISLKNVDDVFLNGTVVNNTSGFDLSSFYGLIGLSSELTPVKIYRKFALESLTEYLADVDLLERTLEQQITGYQMANFLLNADLKSSAHSSSDELEISFTNSIAQMPVSPFITKYRDMDILIIFDSSSDCSELCQVARLFKERNRSLPGIPFCDLGDTTIMKPFEVYYPDSDNEDQGPVVVHFSLTDELGAILSKQFDPFQTFYTELEFEALVGIGNAYVQFRFDEIVSVIRYVMDNKKKT